MRKLNSSNTINEETLKENCGVAYTLTLIGGRWKPTILWHLLEGSLRYSELKKRIPGVSERMLVMQLRELEKDQLISRSVYAEVPPRVEYELTRLGMSMKQLLLSMASWGDMHKSRTGKKR